MMDILGRDGRRADRDARWRRRCGAREAEGRKLLVPYVTGGLGRLARGDRRGRGRAGPTPSRSASPSPTR